MIVASPRDDQAQVGGEDPEPGPFRLVVVGVVHFQSGQPGLGQDGDGLIGDPPAAGDRARVGQHDRPSAGPDQPDRLGRVQRVPAHVGPPARTDPVRAERLTRCGDRARRHHGPGDVRTAHAPAGREGGHLRPGDIHPEVAESLDHGLAATEPVIPDRLGLSREFRAGPVLEVAEQVHAVRIQPGRKFHAGDQ